ncbi:hypothetical protein [Actinopolyspora mzabensis]|nr:hypothetical protein [Actinopolyspora mzabensis]
MSESPAMTSIRYPVELESVSKAYGSGDNAVTALDDVSVSFPPE